MKQSQLKLDAILSKALQEEKLATEDKVFLLGLNEPDHLNKLFAAAKSLREKHFGNQVYMYGFIYTSTYCRNDCRFCFFRRSNSQSQRYRKAQHEIIATAERLAGSGVHLIDVTMGEDPALFNGDGAGLDRLVDMIKSVKEATGLPIMVSPGVIPESILGRLRKAGARWYACYQETHTRWLFNQLRPEQDYDLRLETKHRALDMGLLIEEGLLCGVGETPRDLAHSMEMMQRLNADQVRVMNFVPQAGTPMAESTPPDSLKEALIISVLRLVFPDRLIPATLDVDGLSGLAKRLDAGANVVTSIIPRGHGLAGVAQHSLDIEAGRRTNASVLEVLKTAGLQSAKSEEYLAWINARQRANDASGVGGKIAC